MKYIYFITLLVLASATFGSAQFDNISDGCKNKLTALLGDQNINACFPFTAITPLVSNTGSMPSQDALKKAADAICGLPKCSDSLVSQTQTDVKSACQADITAKNPIATLVDVVLTLYSPTRDSICFKNSTGGYCFIESQAATQQVLQSAPKGQDPTLTFAGAPKEAVCTPCNKAIVNTYLNFQKTNPNAFSDIKEITPQDIDNAKSALTGKCGPNFIDGQVGDSTESLDKFQSQSANQKSDAMYLIANRMSFVALVGTILATI
ncbi:hypothetical protein C1645_875601 [Glomus cerebriforme]|uniref:DUF7729 domain-containing protein n=1 Tax=Glomus cerebriforme TaxID=658196 RepID=A0A397T8G3_9GLOM|nr:hypothetical protein C1645_875601 [Glomus cerebriforme]